MVAKKPKAGTSRRTAGSQVQAYLAAQPANVRGILRKMRADIRAAAPRAVEHFSYRIPGFRLSDEPLVWYAGFKNHVSMFPIGEDIVRTLGLKGYKTAKGTIQFPLDKPPSTALVKRLVKARIARMSRAGASR
jgi:uncharacterized protein YdhG (YjbR/CyaY superfamily)